ncbi:MAG: hypothetical protein LBG76_10670 [Treponema sp.]|jgi:hypothetical protein|nr:hypothetical protein [Treponema sp.]
MAPPCIPRIIHFTIDNAVVLGFDTGLDSQTFAQAKLAQFINQPGWIVYPAAAGEGERRELWRAVGAVEREGTIVIWGPDFPGIRFEECIEAGGDGALDALRYWLRARRFLLLEGEAVSPETPPYPPWPGGTLVMYGSAGANKAYSPGTIFFPPERFLRRSLEAEGDDTWLRCAERWVHPVRAGADALAFSAAALFYRILCGEAPFQSEDFKTIHEDILEGVFLPPHLSAPGLNNDAAALITAIMNPTTGGGAVQPNQIRNEKGPQTSSLERLVELLGAPGSGKLDAFFHPLSGEERAKLEAEREQQRRKTGRVVKTRRFARRNKAALTLCAAAVLAVALIAGSIIQGRKDLPTTKGMKPVEVVEAYYGAITSLDHTLMQACVFGKAGKDDITMVTNTFVLSKVRQAYEMSTPTMSPQEWLDMGSPSLDTTIFGVSDLLLTPEDTDESDGEVRYQARYKLWLPASYLEDASSFQVAEDPKSRPEPQNITITDTVTLSLIKDSWRISGIGRK